MDIAQFRSELARAFEDAGFKGRKIKGSKAVFWTLPGREVERGFGEHAMRRPWGFVLGGVLTIDVPAFRAWLTDRYPPDQLGIVRDCLLSRHIANEPDMFFAVEDDVPPYGDWVRLIKSRLTALPDTVEGLLSAEHQPQRLRSVWTDWEAPPAWDYFKAWAVGDAPRSPPPFRLPDGRIVDAAANDAA